MKIETTIRTHANNEVKFSDGIKVKFDRFGVAEVSDAIGLRLLEKYSGTIYPAGKVVLPMERNQPIIKADSGAVEVLKDSLAKANRMIEDFKQQAIHAKEGEKVWRIKCEELAGIVEKLQGQLGQNIPLNTEPLTAEEKIAADLAALKQQLEAKTVKELIAFAEELKLDKAEYQKLTKAKLVDYLIEKTNNANA